MIPLALLLVLGGCDFPDDPQMGDPPSPYLLPLMEGYQVSYYIDDGSEIRETETQTAIHVEDSSGKEYYRLLYYYPDRITGEGPQDVRLLPTLARNTSYGTEFYEELGDKYDERLLKYPPRQAFILPYPTYKGHVWTNPEWDYRVTVRSTDTLVSDLDDVEKHQCHVYYIEKRVGVSGNYWYQEYGTIYAIPGEVLFRIDRLVIEDLEAVTYGWSLP